MVIVVAPGAALCEWLPVEKVRAGFIFWRRCLQAVVWLLYDVDVRDPGGECRKDGYWWRTTWWRGRTVRWTTSRRRKPPGWTVCRSGRGKLLDDRLGRNSATSGNGFPDRRRNQGTAARRSRSSCTVPCPKLGSLFLVGLKPNKHDCSARCIKMGDGISRPSYACYTHRSNLFIENSYDKFYRIEMLITGGFF